MTMDDKLDLQKVVTLILAEQQHQHETGDAAFRAHVVKPKYEKSVRDGKKRKQCMNCQRFGHTIEKCYLKGSGLEGQGPKRDKKVKVVNDTSDT